MTINQIINKQSFIFKPLKIIQSLGWVAVAILALPTVIGSYFAWKKLAAIWSKKERPGTQKIDQVASEILVQKTTENLLKNWVERAPVNEDRLTAQERILHFLEHPTSLLDLSNLGLSSLPSIFEDKCFSHLQELRLIGNPLIAPLSIRNLTARIIFKESPWHKLHVSQDFTNTLFNKDLDENNFVAMSSENPLTPLEEKKQWYKQAIAQFESSGCLKPSSAEVYLDYLKNIEKNPGFYFNMRLLHKLRPRCNEFLKAIETEVKEVKEKNGSLFFVPFLLAGNFLREQHIVVAVINLKDEKIEYFDPKGNRFYYSILSRSIDRNLAEWNEPTQTFLEKLSKTLFPDQNPSIIRNINYPQSLWNSVDCGAHALEFIEKRLSVDFLEQASSSLTLDGRQLRRELARTLEESLKNQSLKT